MPVESAADRLTFLDADEFGVEASYTPSGGVNAAITGIFNDPHLEVIVGDAAPVADSQPTFTCRSADLPAAAAGGDAGDTLAVDGITYQVADLQPDGTGMTVITLGRVRS